MNWGYNPFTKWDAPLHSLLISETTNHCKFRPARFPHLFVKASQKRCETPGKL